jgi:hypothetical protein
MDLLILAERPVLMHAVVSTLLIRVIIKIHINFNVSGLARVALAISMHAINVSALLLGSDPSGPGVVTHICCNTDTYRYMLLFALSVVVYIYIYVVDMLL